MTADNNIHRANFSDPESVPDDRYNGRTTGLALEAIAKALLNPGVEIMFKDHEPTQHNNQKMRHLIHGIVRRMQLFGFRTGFSQTTKMYFVQFNLKTQKREK